MNASIIIMTEIATFVLSVGASMFVAGTRWGRVESRIEGMADRLAKIEGMFILRLKDPKDELMALLQATILKGEDSIHVAAELPGLDVYCFYTDGEFANGTATKARFPGKKYLGITPFNAVFADCQDIETGDATSADFPAFVKNSQHPNIDKPMAYASLNVMPQVIKAASDAGIPRSSYYLFIANWTGVGLIPAGYDAIQFASNSAFDSDLFYDYVFGAPASVTPPVSPTVVQIEYYKNGFGWVYETPVQTQPTDPGKILLPSCDRIRVRASNGSWSSWAGITPG